MKKLSLLVTLILVLAGCFSVMPDQAAATTQSETTAGEKISGKININTADEAILSTLPGIGEKTAAAIISYRTDNGGFKSIDDLEQVKGIGSKKLAKIRPMLEEL